MVVMYVIKFFRARADRHNSILMSLVLVIETIGIKSDAKKMKEYQISKIYYCSILL